MDRSWRSKETRCQPPFTVHNSGGVVYWGRRPIDLDLHDIDGTSTSTSGNHRDGHRRIIIKTGRANYGRHNVHVSERGMRHDDRSNYPRSADRTPTTRGRDIAATATSTSWSTTPSPAPTASPPGTSLDFFNDGSGKFTDESRARIFGEPGSDDNAVKCVDLNNDGHLDMVVASLQSTSEKVLINDGTTVFNYIGDAIAAGKDPTLGIEIADLTGDGIFDMSRPGGRAQDETGRQDGRLTREPRRSSAPLKRRDVRSASCSAGPSRQRDSEPRNVKEFSVTSHDRAPDGQRRIHRGDLSASSSRSGTGTTVTMRRCEDRGAISATRRHRQRRLPTSPDGSGGAAVRAALPARAASWHGRRSWPVGTAAVAA